MRLNRQEFTLVFKDKSRREKMMQIIRIETAMLFLKCGDPEEAAFYLVRARR